jgi:hypothetical protein
VLLTPDARAHFAALPPAVIELLLLDERLA